MEMVVGINYEKAKLIGERIFKAKAELSE